MPHSVQRRVLSGSLDGAAVRTDDALGDEVGAVGSLTDRRNARSSKVSSAFTGTGGAEAAVSALAFGEDGDAMDEAPYAMHLRA